MSKSALKNLNEEQKTGALKLLEMQLNSMLMYTSCGWFADEISGIETTQVIQYAARAMQLAKDVTGIDLEIAYKKILERAQSNVPICSNGSVTYDISIKPTIVDLLRVGAHYAVSSIFEDYPEQTKIYSYTISKTDYEKVEIGRQKLVTGKAHIQSDIILEKSDIYFAVLHLGDHNFIGGVNQLDKTADFAALQKEIKEKFLKGDVAETIFSIDKLFGSHNYSLWHLFKDEQRKVFEKIIDKALEEIRLSFRQIYEHHHPIMQAMNDMGSPLPKPLDSIMDFIFNADLQDILNNKDIDIVKFQKLTEEAKRWKISFDKQILSFIANHRLEELMRHLVKDPFNLELLEKVNTMLTTLITIPLKLDLWNAQNFYFYTSTKLLNQAKTKADKGDKAYEKWIIAFETLGNCLKVMNS